MARNKFVKTRSSKNNRNRGSFDKKRNAKDEYCEEKSSEKFTSGAMRADRKYNDVSWYSKNEQMLKDAASFSYNRPLGSEIKFDKVIGAGFTNASSAQTQYDASCSSVAGVMTLLTDITPGLSTDYTSPINLAAQNIYSYVRYQNSGAKNYEPADLMFYLLSMDSAYALWNHLKRAYGILRSYNQKNWYYPRAFIEAQGLDFDDMMANISDFRLFLNTTASRLQSFCVPAVMPLFVRHSWMFSNIWKDADNDKAQCYQFVPQYFYKYAEQTAGGGSLITQKWMYYDSNSTIYPNQYNPKLKKFADVREYVDRIVNALPQSEDIGVMSGDILKAYGQDKLFTLSPITEDYTLLPVYEEEVLNQIHNATILTANPNKWEMNNFNITQDVDSQTIVFDPTTTILGTEPLLRSAIVNMPWNDVTPANTMVGTRLISFLQDPTSTGGSTVHFDTMGTEVIMTALVTFNNYLANDANQVTLEHFSFATVNVAYPYAQYSDIPAMPDTSTGAVPLATMKNFYDNVMTAAYRGLNDITTKVGLLSQFDWAPIVYLIAVKMGFDKTTSNTKPANETFSVSAITGDMTNWTVINRDDIAQMHLTAIMSEFNIPQLGSF